MASYLWVRGQTWFFQLRPPSDLTSFLGPTPFIVRLPVQTRREASRCARHLAGLAERWFSVMRYRGFSRLRVHSDSGGDDSWTDQDYRESQAALRKRFLDTLLTEVQDLNREAAEREALSRDPEGDSAAELKSVAEKQKQIIANLMSGWNVFAKELLADYETLFADMQFNSHAFRSTTQELEELNENYKDDLHDWKQRVSKINARDPYRVIYRFEEAV